MDLTLLNLDSPTETRATTIGRATYEPGWRPSEQSGRAAVKMDDAEERVTGPGDVVYVPPGHDSWVVGDDPYMSLHVMGSENYAT
jgi:hypothetical protein